MRTSGRVWPVIVQAEESSTGVGHSDILGLSAFQSGRTEQEGVGTTRTKSQPAGSGERKVRMLRIHEGENVLALPTRDREGRNNFVPHFEG